jgi:hypothetical protein
LSCSALSRYRPDAWLMIWTERQCDIAATRRTTTRRLTYIVKTKVRQHAVWHFVLLSLVPTRPTKAFQISHHSSLSWSAIFPALTHCSRYSNDNITQSLITNGLATSDCLNIAFEIPALGLESHLSPIVK